MAAVPHERAGMASGALNTFRQLGQALGVAAAVVVLALAGSPARVATAAVR